MKREHEATHWLGLDVDKKTFKAGLARCDQHFPHTAIRELPWKSFPRTEAGVEALLVWADQHTADTDDARLRVVMEATGEYSVELAAWLTAQRPSLAPAIVTPTQTHGFIQSMGQRNKTDALDARALAFYGVERRPCPYEPLDPDREELRALNRCRDTLVQEQTRLKNRAQEHCTSRLVARMQQRRLKQLQKDIADLEKEMRKVIKASPRMNNDYNLLLTIPGVGVITACTILAELGDLRRFQRARQLTAFVGVSPRIYASGDTVHFKTHMCKRGNRRVRQALFLSAMATLRTRSNNTFKVDYDRLCEHGLCGKAAIGAIMRKQLTVMRAVIISGKPYDPLWKTRRKTHSDAA